MIAHIFLRLINVIQLSRNVVEDKILKHTRLYIIITLCLRNISRARDQKVLAQLVPHSHILHQITNVWYLQIGNTHFLDRIFQESKEVYLVAESVCQDECFTGYFCDTTCKKRNRLLNLKRR
jgi:hypothetical protein